MPCDRWILGLRLTLGWSLPQTAERGLSSEVAPREFISTGLKSYGALGASEDQRLREINIVFAAFQFRPRQPELICESRENWFQGSQYLGADEPGGPSFLFSSLGILGAGTVLSLGNILRPLLTTKISFFSQSQFYLLSHFHSTNI